MIQNRVKKFFSVEKMSVDYNAPKEQETTSEFTAEATAIVTENASFEDVVIQCIKVQAAEKQDPKEAQA